MSIRAFFEKRPFPAMNRVILFGGLSGNGIRVEGDVLAGSRSVEEALVRDWIRGTVGSSWRPSWEEAGGSKSLAPVLKASGSSSGA